MLLELKVLNGIWSTFLGNVSVPDNTKTVLRKNSYIGEK